MTNLVARDVVHFIHDVSRATPVEKTYLNTDRGKALQFTSDPREVTCPRCLEHPICQEALAQRMEETLVTKPEVDVDVVKKLAERLAFR